MMQVSPSLAPRRSGRARMGAPDPDFWIARPTAGATPAARFPRRCPPLSPFPLDMVVSLRAPACVEPDGPAPVTSCSPQHGIRNPTAERDRSAGTMVRAPVPPHDRASADRALRRPQLGRLAVSWLSRQRQGLRRVGQPRVRPPTGAGARLGGDRKPRVRRRISPGGAPLPGRRHHSPCPRPSRSGRLQPPAQADALRLRPAQVDSRPHLARGTHSHRSRRSTGAGGGTGHAMFWCVRFESLNPRRSLPMVPCCLHDATSRP